MGKKALWIIAACVCVIVAPVLISLALNQTSTRYEDLDQTDRAVLDELAQYVESEQKTPIWGGYELASKPILAVKGFANGAYLVNPDGDVSNVCAARISTPDGSPLRVYRIAAFSPELLQFLMPANFNVLGQTYTVCGNDVYFTKYDESSFGKAFDSNHYLAFLTHEAFHYYMQGSWPSGGRFDTSVMTNDDLDLLGEEYAVLDSMLAELRNEQVDKDALRALATDYVSIVDRRLAANRPYVEAELLSETAEGTATYVGKKASAIVGYDLAIMCFADANVAPEGADLTFVSTVAPMKDGTIDRSLISSNLVYQSGAVLCEVLDALEVPAWKEKLNAQTLDTPVTLYSIMAEYLSASTS